MTWDMVPYDVQLIGGIALHRGMVAEMATGEGKTLVANMPLSLKASPGGGAHRVTAAPRVYGHDLLPPMSSVLAFSREGWRR